MNLPKHIVVVPDGNRRWARKKGLAGFLGHEKGAKSAEAILRAALDFKTPYFTLWGSSADNITKRSKAEVKFLLAVFKKYFEKLLKSKEIRENKIRVRVLGRWRELFPASVKKPMEEIVEKTKNYSAYNFTILMAYSGVDEMTEAVRRIASAGRRASVISEKIIKEHLWTCDLPPVDLVIRTGGEPHWSAGLMMWDVANAQLYFTKTLWPVFSPAEFKKAVLNCAKTERRFGK